MSEAKPDKIFKWFYLSIFILMLSLVLTEAARGLVDNDFYHILTAGRDIVETGHIPSENLYSVVPGMKMMYQQWAYSLTCYNIFRYTGFVGLYAFMLLLAFFLCYVSYLFFRDKGLSKYKAFCLSPSVVCVLAVFGFLNIRPFLLTTCLLCTQLFWTSRYLATNEKGYLFGIVMLFLIETNFRMSMWWLHLIFLLPYIVDGLLSRVKWKYRRNNVTLRNAGTLAVTGVAGAAVTLLNPYGLNGSLFLVRAYGELNRVHISELTPFEDFGSFRTWMLLIFLIACLVKTCYEKRLDFSMVFLIGGSFVLMLMASRSTSILVAASIVIFADIYAGLDKTVSEEKVLSKKSSRTAVRGLSVLSVLLAVFVFLTYWPMFPARPDMKNIYGEWRGSSIKRGLVRYTVGELDDMADIMESEKERPVVWAANTGGFFEWRGFRVALDPRWEWWGIKLNKKYDSLGECAAMIRGDMDVIESVLGSGQYDYAVGEFDDVREYLKNSDLWQPMDPDNENCLVFRYIGGAEHDG